jgi:hypothetical protein
MSELLDLTGPTFLRAKLGIMCRLTFRQLSRGVWIVDPTFDDYYDRFPRWAVTGDFAFERDNFFAKAVKLSVTDFNPMLGYLKREKLVGCFRLKPVEEMGDSGAPHCLEGWIETGNQKKLFTAFSLKEIHNAIKIEGTSLEVRRQRLFFTFMFGSHRERTDCYPR